MATQDYEKYQNLHTIIMLKDVIRKWWGLELAFANRSGYVLDHATGQIIASNNDFCRLSLFSKEGFRHCNQSVKYIGDKFFAKELGVSRSNLISKCERYGLIAPQASRRLSSGGG